MLPSSVVVVSVVVVAAVTAAVAVVAAAGTAVVVPIAVVGAVVSARGIVALRVDDGLEELDESGVTRASVAVVARLHAVVAVDQPAVVVRGAGAASVVT